MRSNDRFAGSWLSIAAVLTLALGGGGCSLIPRLGGHASAEPDSASAMDAAADSAGTGPADTLEIRANAPDTTAHAVAPDSTENATDPGPASDPPPAATAGSNGSRGNPAVSIDLGAGERSRLEVEARRDLADAEFVVRSVRRDHLDTVGLERLSAVEGLIEQARSAYAADDLESAASFARKARLLALEVTEKP